MADFDAVYPQDNRRWDFRKRWGLTVLVTCIDCKKQVSLNYESNEMSEHGVFVVDEGDENIICPSSGTSNFKWEVKEPTQD